MHKTIFTWFGNLPTSTKLLGFHYYQGKIQSVVVQFFSLSENLPLKTTQHHFELGRHLDQTQLGSIKPNKCGNRCFTYIYKCHKAPKRNEFDKMIGWP